MIIKKFSELNSENHWNEKLLNGYIYESVFDDLFFNNLKRQIEGILNYSSTQTFLTHNTIFTINNETKKIVSHSQNGREQHVLFDLFFDPSWFNQTSNTIKNWSIKKIKNTISPVFYKCIEHFYNSEPFNKDNKWVCYRMHLNVLEYKKVLSLHLDTNHMMYNTPYAADARCYSVTFYLEDHVENCGGELFSINGFTYKPVKNSAIAINGNQVSHGVTENCKVDKSTRLAFTMRFAYIDDLFLPGSLSKCLYKLDHL